MGTRSPRGTAGDRSRSTVARVAPLANRPSAARDFNVQTYFDEKIDIHHIFPKKWCEGAGVHRRQYDSIINKTAISARTNRMIGGNAPSTYLGKVEKSAGIPLTRMNDILASHVIDAGHLRTDAFEKFFATRQAALRQRVEKAIGKATISDAPPVVDLEEYEDDDEEPENSGG